MFWILTIATILGIFSRIPAEEKTCITHLERVNCTDQDKSELHYICESSHGDNCSCVFDNPLRSEVGWFKACHSKNSRNVRKKKVRKRQVVDSNLCGTIAPPRPGKVSCSMSRIDIKCIGTCDHDHQFIDGTEEQVYSCLYADGVWTPVSEFPRCEPKCNPPCENGGTCMSVNFCTCPNDYRGNTCQYPITLCAISKNKFASNWKCNHTRSETTCDISCHPPDTPEAELDVTRYGCSVEGVWNPQLPPCVQELKDVQDKSIDLDVLPLGGWQVEERYGIGSNTAPSPEAVRVKGGISSVAARTPYTLQVPLCDKPQDSENGRWDLLIGHIFSFGSRVVYSCDEGYVLQGEKYSDCNRNGTWTNNPPICIRHHDVKVCQDPGETQYGRRNVSSEEYLEGSSIAYECLGNFTVLGNAVIKCMGNGQWSSDKPQCIPKRQTSVFCSKPNAPKNSLVHVTFPGHHPLATVLNKYTPVSQRLHIIAKGEEKELAVVPEGTFVVGTRVQYKCKSRFYKLYGSEYQTCQSSRTWSGYQPACIPECGKSDSPKTPFIVNGNSSHIGQWPWQVGLALKSHRGLNLLCGGVLINELWILTAAHCVTKRLSNVPMPANSLLVFCGKYYRSFDMDDEFVQVKEVRQVIIHEEYDFIHFDVDIALLQIDSPVELTTRVQPVCLPTEDTTRENIRDGKRGIVTGWGITENGKFSETLKETVLPVVSYDRCEEAYRAGLRSVTITKNMFCAGYESGHSDTCNGDSGGPLMFAVGPANDVRWYLEGIVSWGSESGCGKSLRYSGFTKVGRFVPWISMYI